MARLPRIGAATTLAAVALCGATLADAQTVKTRAQALELTPDRTVDRARDDRGRFAFALDGLLVPSDTTEEGVYVICGPPPAGIESCREVPVSEACTGEVILTIERRVVRDRRTRFSPVLRQRLALDPRDCTFGAIYRTTRDRATFRIRARFLGSALLSGRRAPTFDVRTSAR